MRVIFGLLLVGMGLVSVAVTARYGYMMTDTTLDAALNAAIYGFLSLCVLAFHAGAVRLWVSGWRRMAIVSGLVGVIAFVPSFSNAFGGIRQPWRCNLGRARESCRCAQRGLGGIGAFAGSSGGPASFRACGSGSA